ncbi:uncharacterized protein LOC134197811 isoform X2 [Corticium candelabrum]|uniref:uncharacterized protein LOC134197811 isoform X2 n=1 Tax=Corticium candelabrum TaxID=121492 RepID=UPI002E2604B5|nr:uncharacterized protein LOC134197811 isoform X2 [Corticium candelabrum]
MASYCFTVFAGSKVGVRPEYLTAAKELGKALAERRCSLIYGGSSLGLLGAVAKSVEDHGGKVTGILPKFFAEREGHTAIGEEVLVEDLAARKVIMLEKSDGFIALPGGFGTLDEFFEVLVLRQLNQSKSPIGLLNVSNYYQHLTKLILLWMKALLSKITEICF